MKYAGKTFTLYASQPVAIQGSDSLYTYQNTGTGTATIVGSNNAVNWTSVATVVSGASYTGSHAYAFLMMTGSTEVSVSRGAAGDNSFSSSNPLPTSMVNLFDNTTLECARGNIFLCRIVTTSLGTGKFLSITLQNPTGSGEVLYFVGGHCNTSGAAVQQTYQRTIAPTGADITGTLIKNANPSAGRTTQAKLWKDDLAAASTPTAAIWGKVATATTFYGATILYSNVFPVIAAGEAITLEHLTANLSGELVLVFISKPA